MSQSSTSSPYMSHPGAALNMDHLQRQEQQRQQQQQREMQNQQRFHQVNASQESFGQGGSGEGGSGYTPEQLEVLKRQYAAQPQAAGSDSVGEHNNSKDSSNAKAGKGPYMVLTQVAVPSHMVGQLSQQQLAQLQQQQQQGGNKSNQQQQILSLNQLPAELQQQVLLHQQQFQQQQQQQQQGSQSQRTGQQDLQSQLQQQLRQQLQQQQRIQQQQQQQQQQQLRQGASYGNMNTADMQEFIKNNGGELNGNMMQQMMNRQAANQNNNSYSDLFNPFNDSSDRDSNSDVSNSNKRLFLETQVQPVQRQDNTANQNYGDDDLFKFLEMEMGDASGDANEDFMGPNVNKKGTDMNYSFLEPTPLFQQQQGSHQHVQTGSAGQQQVQPNRTQSSRQQRMPKSSPSSSGKPPSNNAQKDDDDETFMLPSTVMPPTVLASVCKGTAMKRVASTKKKPTSKKVKRVDSPQDVLMRLAEKQGHGELQRIKSEDAGYDTMPSPLQLSSFGTQVVHAVHTSDDEMLGKLLSCGLSPNPCNQFRDSILDLVCKRSNVAIFNCLLEHGCDLRVVDGFGRTPLHHCAWASSFCREVAEAILERDPLQLFIEDKRGQSPMEYVRPDQMSDWNDFLEEMAEKFLPKGGAIARLTRPKDSRPDGTLPDPKNAVSAGLASMISSGSITPEQLAEMDETTKKSYG